MRALSLALILVAVLSGAATAQEPLDSLRYHLREATRIADQMAADTVTPPDTTAPPPVDPAFYVPDEIASDCRDDVSAQLKAWIRSVPDSSTLKLKQNACYNIGLGLQVLDRHGLTLDGQGSELRRVGTGGRLTGNLAFQGGSNLTLRSLVLRGANPKAGVGDSAYVIALEGQAGIYLAQIQGALIEDVKVFDVYGDFILMGHDYRLLATQFPGLPNRDVLIRRFHVERNGRMGIAVTHGERITIEDGYLGQVRLSGIDMEPDDAREVVRGITIQRVRFGPIYHYAIVSGGQSTVEGMRDVVVRDNVMEHNPPTCLGVIRMRSRGRSPGWVVERNRLKTRGGGIGIQMEALGGGTVTDNVIENGSVGGCGAVAPVQVLNSISVSATGTQARGSWVVPVAIDAYSKSMGSTESGNTLTRP